METVPVTVSGWCRQARAFAVRYLRETARAPVGLFWSFAFPAVWYLITAHLGGLGGRAGGPELLDLSLPSLPPGHHPSVADRPHERRPHPYP